MFAISKWNIATQDARVWSHLSAVCTLRKDTAEPGKCKSQQLQKYKSAIKWLEGYDLISYVHAFPFEREVKSDSVLKCLTDLHSQVHSI